MEMMSGDIEGELMMSGDIEGELMSRDNEWS